ALLKGLLHTDHRPPYVTSSPPPPPPPPPPPTTCRHGSAEAVDVTGAEAAPCISPAPPGRCTESSSPRSRLPTPRCLGLDFGPSVMPRHLRKHTPVLVLDRVGEEGMLSSSSQENTLVKRRRK
ncbi:hypothetical protein INR49_025450, partial [Caranx melampygus]